VTSPSSVNSFGRVKAKIGKGDPRALAIDDSNEKNINGSENMKAMGAGELSSHLRYE